MNNIYSIKVNLDLEEVKGKVHKLEDIYAVKVVLIFDGSTVAVPFKIVGWSAEVEEETK